jgi:hypothetical protein
MLVIMPELATTARPVGIVVKTTRRLAVALTMSIGVGLLMMTTWRSSPSSLFLRTVASWLFEGTRAATMLGAHVETRPHGRWGPPALRERGFDQSEIEHGSIE